AIAALRAPLSTAVRSAVSLHDALPIYGDAGPVDVGVGLGVGGGDHLVHVDAVGGGEGAELVRQGDVHVPVGGLGQLGHLRGLGAAQVPHPVRAVQVRPVVEGEHRLIELLGAVRARSRESAYAIGERAQ